MTQTIGPSAPGVFPASPIFNALVPREGPKMVPFTADFSLSASYLADLQQTVSAGRISVIQSVWIDNSANAAKVSVSAQGSNQTISAPPGSQGFYPITVGNVPKFLITSLGTAIVEFEFLNVPVPASVWEVAGITSVAISGPVTSAGALEMGFGPGTDWASFSGTTANPAASTQLFPADANRVAVAIAAPTTDDLWVNRVGGIAAIGGSDCFRIPKGTLYESQPGQACGQAWTYFCATVSLTYTALSQGK